jgi:hypothetical protein
MQELRTVKAIAEVPGKTAAQPAAVHLLHWQER